VLDEIREGRRNRDIAERLRLSIHTVKSHVASMLAKLDLTSRRQLAEWPGAPAQRDAHEADDRARTLRFAPVFGRTPPRAPW
jgi:DNA-binding MarR family transcriptional regulator